MTLKEFEELNPDWKTYPDIFVTWTWDEESYKKQFKDCSDKTSSPAEYFMKFNNLEDAQKAAYEARKGLDKFSDKSPSPQRREE